MIIDRSSIEISKWTGTELKQNIFELAQLRIQVFKSYPYLYDGSVDYEVEYLDVYQRSSRSVVVVAKHNGKIIGAASALPLTDENEYIKKPFVDSGMDVRSIFYFGESVLLPEFRGLGIGHKFFDYREQAALSYGEYSMTCFCAVDRPEDHPLRPRDYRPLNEFWQKRGYCIQPQLKSQFSWKEIHENNESLKPMTYWLKVWK